jgi:hypothetical protein
LITPPPLTFDDVCIREESMSPPPLSFDNPEVPIHEESVPLTPFEFDSDQMATVPSTRRHEDNKTELEGHQVSPRPSTPSAKTETDDEEPWEEDVHETMAGISPREIRG